MQTLFSRSLEYIQKVNPHVKIACALAKLTIAIRALERGTNTAGFKGVRPVQSHGACVLKSLCLASCFAATVFKSISFEQEAFHFHFALDFINYTAGYR